MRWARFLAPLSFLPLVTLAIFVSGIWSFILPAIVFVLIPVIEMCLPRDVVNLTPDEEAVAQSDWRYDAALWAWVPIQVGIVIAFMWRVSTGAPSMLELVGITLTVGVCCGAFGINVAHDLGHRTNTRDKILAKILLLSSMYSHFIIEHNRGHHRRVSTPEDPASARRGEPVYAFWLRSVTSSWRSAWSLEARRLERLGQSPWSLDNEMLRLQLLQATALAAALAVFGPFATVMWVAAGTVGFLLLETINYIEHYGLVHNKTEHGVYERVGPHHSWNADYPLGRFLLFELTRHSDHHANATRKYQTLRHCPDAPQLPTGYPGMIVISLVPPLWFRLMHQTLDDYNHQRAAA